jgi:hypothetical protein
MLAEGLKGSKAGLFLVCIEGGDAGIVGERGDACAGGLEGASGSSSGSAPWVVDHTVIPRCPNQVTPQSQ